MSSGGRLSLQDTEPLLLKAGRKVDLVLHATVKAEACGEDVDFELTTKLGEDSWSASASLPSAAGIGKDLWQPTTTDSWVAMTESAQQGGWEYGVPNATFFAGRTLQPAGASGGANSSAWMTGLDGLWNESTLIGSSSLVSSSFDLAHWHNITGIEYNLWYVALDRSSPVLDPSDVAHLIVELSDDDGKTWSEIDSVSGEVYRWETRSVTFPPVDSSSTMKLRFTVQNDATVDQELVEVGFDSVALQGGELLCTPVTGGCGCSHGRSSDTALLLWFIPAFVFLRRQNRRTNDHHR